MRGSIIPRMSSLKEHIPDYMWQLLPSQEERNPLMDFLNCYCIAAIFHSKKILDGMKAISQLDNENTAKRFLTNRERFEIIVDKEEKRRLGTINLMVDSAVETRSTISRLHWLHVSVNLSGREVLAKDGFRNSDIVVRSYEQDLEQYKYWHPVRFLLIPNE